MHPLLGSVLKPGPGVEFSLDQVPVLKHHWLKDFADVSLRFFLSSHFHL